MSGPTIPWRPCDHCGEPSKTAVRELSGDLLGFSCRSHECSQAVFTHKPQWKLNKLMQRP